MAKKIVNGIYWSIVGLAGIFGALVFLSVISIPGNYKIFIVRTGSMEPKIGQGSVIVVKPSGVYSVNDVITFKNAIVSETPITHRIIEIGRDGQGVTYATKGDANGAPDMNKIHERDIVGKVRGYVPYFGYVVDFIKKPMIFIWVVIIPIAVIISGEIRKLIKEIGAMKQAKE